VIKIGLVLVRDEHVLLVRRNTSPILILPGGKPEGGETDEQTLAREIEEELHCRLDPARLEYLGEYEDELADDPSRRVVIRLYRGELEGRPQPSAEIGEVVWHPLVDLDATDLAPSLRHQILRDLAEG
jgi:8-oxo-dGTP diphosphatase